ncbi:hypothetical protein OC25_24080 [Pedobacter kyungheensis]|uniref:Uncharacterized protein n=1 Tax=Pedobacter kyungheensis TaxID=1069985 RepID=A0A0C1FGC9_9SPHI|nr:hypothetical protein [Pedobacter kyungheensis]KIA90863.1 hypothetical protein OC25_24080 [Pedobacter kyungheensis]
MLLTTTSVVIYSCKKNREASITELNTQLLNESRTYFQSIILKQIALNDNNIRHSIEKMPLWDKAFVKKISVGNAVIVPIKYKNDILLRPQDSDNNIIIGKTSYLIIFKDQNKSWCAEWVTLIPMANKIKGKFVGIVNIEDWNGQFKRAYAVGENGGIKNIYKDESFIFKKINYASTTCIRIDHYSGVGVDGYMQYTYLGSETFCFGGGNGGGNTDNAPDLDNNGGTSGGGEPNDYTSMYDCNNDLNGSARIENCGCIGGNTGIQSCADITDKIKNKCLDSVWIKVKDTLNNKIAKILNNTFNTSDKINFKIVDGNIDGGYAAKTEVVTDKVNSDGIHVFDVKVTLNKNTLPSASQEFIATTMVHEIMHAYFDSQKTYYTQQFQQHRNMAENYIDDLKNAVQAIYSSLDDKAAYALILNGFGDIFKNDLTYWNSLVSKYDLDNAQIINIRDSYKSHNSGTKTACSQ